MENSIDTPVGYPTAASGTTKGFTVFPAIDLINGACVRLFQGDFDQQVQYSKDPVETAKEFQSAGSDWIHVVDLEGARVGHPIHGWIIQEIASLGLKVQCGGGIRTLQHIEKLLESGVDRVILGSVLVRDEVFRKEAVERFGAALVAGLDVRNEKIAIAGWQEQTEIDLIEFGQQLSEIGYQRMIVTDIATDGTMQGPNLELARKVLAKVNMKYIISGGVSKQQDLLDSALIGAEGLIVGKALYEGTVSLHDWFNTITA